MSVLAFNVKFFIMSKWYVEWFWFITCCSHLNHVKYEAINEVVIAQLLKNVGGCSCCICIHMLFHKIITLSFELLFHFVYSIWFFLSRINFNLNNEINDRKRNNWTPNAHRKMVCADKFNEICAITYNSFHILYIFCWSSFLFWGDLIF